MFAVTKDIVVIEELPDASYERLIEGYGPPDIQRKSMGHTRPALSKFVQTTAEMTTYFNPILRRQL
jgi:hypothetical protein